MEQIDSPKANTRYALLSRVDAETFVKVLVPRRAHVRGAACRSVEKQQENAHVSRGGTISGASERAVFPIVSSRKREISRRWNEGNGRGRQNFKRAFSPPRVQ